MPAEFEDRAADCWEPLLAIADEAGDDWPTALGLRPSTLPAMPRRKLRRWALICSPTTQAFGDDDRLWTEKLLKKLCDRDESPWKDMSDGSAGKEKPLNDRGPATRLKPYGIRSRSVRNGDLHRKGYMVEDFFDAWARYCPSASDERDKRDKRDIFDNQNNLSRMSRMSRRGWQKGKRPACRMCLRFWCVGSEEGADVRASRSPARRSRQRRLCKCPRSRSKLY